MKITPRTWETGEYVHSDLLQGQITDNLIGLERFKIKQSSNLVKTTDTVLENLPGLKLPMLAGETWDWMLFSHVTTNATAQVKYAAVSLNVNDIATDNIVFGVYGLLAYGIPVTAGFRQTYEGTVPTVVNAALNSTLRDCVVLSGTATAIIDCSMQIQAAQQASSGTTTFHSETFLVAWRSDDTINANVWPKNELNLAATFNTRLRDKLKAFYTVVKAQDATLTKNASTVFSDLSNMNFAVLSGEVWIFFAHSFVAINVAADAKYTVTAPAASTGGFGIVSPGLPLTAGSAATFGNPVACSILVATPEAVIISGVVTAGANGTVQLQAAQNTSNAANDFWYVDSFIVAHRVSA